MCTLTRDQQEESNNCAPLSRSMDTSAQSSPMEVPRIGSDPSTHKELAGDPPLTDLATVGVWVLFTHLPHHPGLQRSALFLGYLLQLVRQFQKVLFLYLVAIEMTIHQVRHSSLQLLLKLLFRAQFVVWLASSIPQRRCFSSAHASALDFVERRQASSLPVVGAPGPRLCPWPRR